MRTVLFLLGASGLVLGLSGCGRSLPAAADPETARQALRIALDTWQQGGSWETLRQRSPAIYFTDLDWRAGCRLRSYQLHDSEPHGVQLRCPVVLKLVDPQGKEKEKTTTYLIDTAPAIVIVPADF